MWPSCSWYCAANPKPDSIDVQCHQKEIVKAIMFVRGCNSFSGWIIIINPRHEESDRGVGGSEDGTVQLGEIVNHLWIREGLE